MLDVPVDERSERRTPWWSEPETLRELAGGPGFDRRSYEKALLAAADRIEKLEDEVELLGIALNEAVATGFTDPERQRDRFLEYARTAQDADTGGQGEHGN